VSVRSQVVCPLLSQASDVRFCDTRCGWYLARSATPGCAVLHIALFIAGIVTEMQNR